MSSTLPIDLLSPEFTQNPIPMIDRMHAESPVVFDARLHGWIVGGYRDVKALESEPRLTSARAAYVSALTPPELHEQVKPLVDWYSEWMVMRDGSDHRRLRRLTAHAFQPHQLQQLEGRIDEVVDRIVATGIEQGELEIASALAFPLPRTVICEMVGIPEADMGLFSEWTPNINLLLGAGLTSAEIIEQVAASRAAMVEYFSRQIEDRRKTPRPGEVLSSLVQALEEGDALTQAEMIDLVAFILSGAYNTTAHLIVNGLWLLLSNPEQLAAVRADPSLIDGWIEEALRCEPPLTINTRAVAEAFEYEGNRFEPGQMIYFLASAANRDPEHFPEPHRFDIQRANSRDHISFGFGPHFCIGAALARLEARRVFHRLIERTQEIALPEQEIRWMPNMIIRGIESLRVTLR